AGGLDVVAYIYPPVFAALLRPLAALPHGAAAALWFWLSLAWLALGVALTARWAGLGRAGLVAGLLWAAALPPTHDTLLLGQVNTLLLALVAGAFAAAGREPRGAWGEALAGALLALAAAIKLFPAVFVLVLAAHGRRRAVAAFALALAALMGAGALVAGPGLTWAWLAEVLPRYAGGFATPFNQSLALAIGRLFSPTEVTALWPGLPARRVVLAPLVARPALGLALGYGAAALVAAATAGALLRRWARLRPWARPTTLDPLEVGLLMAAALLALPLSWYHYGPLLLISWGAAWPHAATDRRLRLALLAGALVYGAQGYWRLLANLGAPALVSLGAAGMLVLWGALLWRVWRDPGPRPQAPAPAQGAGACAAYAGMVSTVPEKISPGSAPIAAALAL
ncbi:MAG TPA: glycosyltransferase 87 family protein, partial [Chloroflexaceae bacterium]|nr:glycosyltransferase 87 family protein [Chloroflexaceae bacterium]